MEVVAAGLDDIFPFVEHRPFVCFYDNGCKLRRWFLNHPVLAWAGTRWIIDR